MEVEETLNKILKESPQVWLAREIPTNQGTFTFDPGRLSAIKCRILYQELETNKATRDEPNKSTKEII